MSKIGCPLAKSLVFQWVQVVSQVLILVVTGVVTPQKKVNAQR